MQYVYEETCILITTFFYLYEMYDIRSGDNCSSDKR